ncbi:TPA: 30S ribosomal protein S15 [Patescibacteria group bacterium]|nr:30S ribosomal protein S15 [Patescibacteria group bacterium]HCI04988.1 30S ribosomal protein S15 [Patescibacteria group bacterium]
MLDTKKKQKIIEDIRVHKTDTGSTDVQIGIITERISELVEHLKAHPKDNHSRRGLLKMVADRRSLSGYLAKKDLKRYNALAKKLDLKAK